MSPGLEQYLTADVVQVADVRLRPDSPCNELERFAGPVLPRYRPGAERQRADIIRIQDELLPKQTFGRGGLVLPQ